jgi:2-oxoglutarate dehydrogenase E1 component
MTTLIEKFRQNSSLSGGNAPFVEDLYERYLQDADSVDNHWRR